LGGTGITLGATGSTVTIPGILTSKHAVRAAEIINGGTGALGGSGFGFASGTRTALGKYRLTLSSPYTAIFPAATASHPTAQVFTTINAVNATQFDVFTYFHD